ncbi:MAG: DUF58 domain-containing protein [Pirellulaceae bacterium]|nr:DUF58 domain-containing protein [Pirellulaceae bacterium]
MDETCRKVRYRHRFTRLGVHFVFVATFAMVGGSIRGFNLLLVLAGFLVAALIVQWRTSRRAIESIVIARRLPDEAFAETPFRIRYQIRNRGRWLSVWMARVDDVVQWVNESSSGTTAVGGSVTHPLACGVGVVAAGSVSWAHCECVMAKRGRYRFGPVRLSTSFPFALLTASSVSDRKRSDLASEIFVYPRLLNLRPAWRQQLLNQHGGMAMTARRSGANEGEFFGLRQWQSGDSPRWIHWRTTARIGDLAVRQFEQERHVDLCLLVDAYCPSMRSRQGHQAVELAISLAATLAMRLSLSPTSRVSLVVAGDVIEAVASGRSSPSRHRMLQMLSGLQASSTPELVTATEQAFSVSAGQQDLIVISTRSMDDAISSQHRNTDSHSSGDLESQLAAWRRRRSMRWIDVHDASLSRWIDMQSVDGSLSSTDGTRAMPMDRTSDWTQRREAVTIVEKPVADTDAIDTITGVDP